MTNESLGSAREIFVAASEIASAEEREAYLRTACGTDLALRRRIDALLIAFERPERLLDQVAKTADDEPLTKTIDHRPTTLNPGDAIGPYRLREQIGEGGMGTVFVAEQVKPLRRKVALKVIKPGMDSLGVIARFEAERQALAIMDHPNIAKVFEAGTTDYGRPYFVMELVRGTSITQFCDEHKLTIRERLDLFTRVCDAITHAHQKGIIHRDIKPSNVLVTEQDGKAIPKVIDFGVAKAIGQSLTDRTIYTGFLTIVGTPLYMSPEQAASSNVDVDTRSDVYSLGVLLYELLTGTTPFDKDFLRQAAQDEVMRIIREQDPPKPSTRVSSLSEQDQTVLRRSRTDFANLGRTLRGELDWIIMKALEKDRSRRYETTTQFANDIENYLSERAVTAGPPSAWYQLRKAVRRHRGAAASLLVALGLLIVIALVLGWKNSELSAALAATERAERETMSLNDFFINGLLGQADPDLNPYQEKMTVVELLDRAATKIDGDSEFDKHEEIAATIRLVIGKTYFALGQWQRAMDHLQTALVIRREKLPNRDPRTLEALAALLELQIEMEDYDTALESAQELEDSWRNMRGSADPHCLTARLHRCSVLMMTGRYSEAESLAKEALRVAVRELGERDGVSFRARQAVADVLSAQFKDFKQARSMYEENLAVLRDKQRDEHSTEMLTLRLRMIEHLVAEGRAAEAEEQSAEILRTRSTRTLPDGHPHTIMARILLGSTQMNLGKINQASENLRTAYTQTLDVLGEDHATTWLARHSLVMAASTSILLVPNRREIAEEAERFALRNVEVGRTRQWPEDHSNIHQNQIDLALVLAIKAMVTKAESGLLGLLTRPPGFIQAKEILEKLYAFSKSHRGPAHPLTIQSGMHLVQIRLMTGENSKELEELVFELWSSTQEVPDGLPVRANLAQSLGLLLAARGRSDEAEPLLRQYFDFCHRSASASQVDRMSAITGLVQCLRQQGREKQLGVVGLDENKAHRVTVKRMAANPMVTIRTGFVSPPMVGFENSDDHTSYLYVAPRRSKSVTVSCLTLAAEPPPGNEELDVWTCDLTKDDKIHGKIEVGKSPSLPVNGFPFASANFTMKAGLWYRIEAVSQTFRPNLWIEDAHGKVVKWLVDRPDEHAQLDFSPQAEGEFSRFVFPTKRNTGGEFTLSMQEYTPVSRMNLETEASTHGSPTGLE